MTREEKLKLYNAAKEAYYNGQEIMTDIEFDELEKELGLENKSYIGIRHNPSYTVHHPFVMGSLSKVQIHEKDSKVDWPTYYQEVKNYVTKNNFDPPLIITPKYDGCSFEIHIDDDNSTITISSRGDGNYGRDLYDHLINKIPKELLELGGEYVLRGEVLVKISTFINKYVDQFTNPRSFVAGVLGNDYSDNSDFQTKLNDLDIVIYDYRFKLDGEWIDKDWTDLTHISNVKTILPDFHIMTTLYTFDDELQLKEIYDKFDTYRKESAYALDGFVIKPIAGARKLNLNEGRPKDCVAIKFIPMLQETEIVNITWNIGKTGEYIPIVWVKPVEMDGRMVQKCSGHNYGYLLEKNVGIGSKIIMSLAGDIIPFLYKVTETGGDIPMPENYNIDGIHLMAELSEEEIKKRDFIYSAIMMNIPHIGPSTAEDIYDYLTQHNELDAEFFGEEPNKDIPENILELRPEQIYFGAGAGKAGNNAKKAFTKVMETLTLKEIINSLNIKSCGNKAAEQVEKYLLGKDDFSFSNLSKESYQWAQDKDSKEMKKLNNILEKLGKGIEDFREIVEKNIKIETNQIPVILTGEPNNYKSKAEFLKYNPQYRQTGSWKEVQIVFTNSLESNTGKMKKAREKNIKIELY